MILVGVDGLKIPIRTTAHADLLRGHHLSELKPLGGDRAPSFSAR